MGHSVERAVDGAGDAMRRAGNSKVVERGAKAGHAASGLVHLMLGWLALQLAMNKGGSEVDQGGALTNLASTALGKGLVGACVAAFVLLALWQFTETVVQREWGPRLKALAKGVTYAALAWTAIQVLTSGAKSGDNQASDFTAKLMSAPAGTWLVGAVGLGILGVGGYHVYKGAAKKFKDDLVKDPGDTAVAMGMFGYIAKGVALISVGALFLRGAAEHKPKDTQGLDGALRALLGLPLGQALLGVIALGLAAYGIYSFFRARHAKV